VLVLSTAQTICQRALVDPGADRLAGARDGLEEQAQVGVDFLVVLAADEELAEGDPLVHGRDSTVRASSAWRTRRRRGAPRRGRRRPAPCRARRRARPRGAG